MQTCLYFGTFNPIHAGHLMIAQAVLNQFSGSDGLRRILFIPANNPPHREGEPDLTAARHRLNMVRLATAFHPDFQVSDIELQREGRSYTMDTIRQLLDQGLVRKPVPMIIGSDALANLAVWHEAKELCGTIRFLQAPRPDCAFVETIRIDGETCPLDTRPVDMPLIGLSSTRIRRILLDKGNYGSLRALVPEAARQYMMDNRLYLPAPS